MLAKEEEFIARFAARASHAAQVQSRVKKLEKIERIEIPAEEKVMNFDLPEAPRSGNDVVKMDRARQGLEARRRHEQSRVQRRERRGAAPRQDRGRRRQRRGQIDASQNRSPAIPTPTAGAVALGASVKVGYFSQHSLDVLNPNKTIFDEVHDRIPDATIGYVRNLLGAFLFSGDDVDKKIGVLSGGEKSRVVLATILASPVNLLVLDEPTNHLDIKSREILLEAIQDFDGTVMLVSHDRHFLRSVAHRVFEVDHGEIRAFEGGYEYYQNQKQNQNR